MLGVVGWRTIRDGCVREHSAVKSTWMREEVTKLTVE